MRNVPSAFRGTLTYRINVRSMRQFRLGMFFEYFIESGLFVALSPFWMQEMEKSQLTLLWAFQ